MPVSLLHEYLSAGTTEIDRLCAPDSHHSVTLNCQRLSDLGKIRFRLHQNLSVPVLSNHTLQVSVCYMFNQIYLKYFEASDKSFCHLLTLYAILL